MTLTDRKASSYLLLPGERSQTQEHFRFFGERFGGEALISELIKAAPDLVIDSLAVLTGIDFNTQVLVPEELDGGQCLCLECVESQFDALNIIVASAGEVGAAQNTLLENGVGALKVEHFWEFSFPAEDFIPSFKIGQGAGKTVEEKVVPSRGSDGVFYRVFEQSHNDFVGSELSSCKAFLDDVGVRPPA